jgi:hypothetical protein
MENTQPDSYPTTSDISMLMRDLGFKWSNDAQIYYHDDMNRYEHLSRKTADRLYKILIGNTYYIDLKTSLNNKSEDNK